MKTFFSILMWVINVVVALALLASCWAGHIDPRWLPIAAVVAMTVPITVPVALGLLVIDCFRWKRQALVLGVCIAASAPGALQTFALSWPASMPDPDDATKRTFTLLTYNVIHFIDQDERYPGDVNPTMGYILSADADIVCLQEVLELGVSERLHLRAAQIDSLSQRYPHIIVNGSGAVLFSKFPVTPLDIAAGKEPGCDVAAYAIDIYGKRVAVYNVHLRSFGLTGADRNLYRDLTKLHGKGRMDEVKTELIRKIETAAVERADEMEVLTRDIQKTGGANVIVCGDFNDVPGSWSVRRLGDIDLRPVWPDTGLGYMRTYNRNRFYFQIDHVLWRGNMQPVRMQRGNVTCSDHFPVLTTWVIDTSGDADNR